MTEADWFECHSLSTMIDCLKGKMPLHKSLWFGGACCHRVEKLIPGKRRRAGLQVMDRWLLGSATLQELVLSVDRMFDGWAVNFRDPLCDAKLKMNWSFVYLFRMLHENLSDHMCLVSGCVIEARQLCGQAEDEEEDLHIAFLRDIVGNPFRPASLDPRLATPDVKALAQGSFDEARFADMPRLAVALEQAGCTDVDILAHCRGRGPHVRGCWVIDLILGQHSEDTAGITARPPRGTGKGKRKKVSKPAQPGEISSANRHLMNFFAAMNDWWKNTRTAVGKRPKTMSESAYHIKLLSAGHEGLLRIFAEYCFDPRNTFADAFPRGNAYFPVDKISERRTIRTAAGDIVFQMKMPDIYRGYFARYRFRMRKKEGRWLVDHMEVRDHYSGF
jgi:hypothetical protein